MEYKHRQLYTRKGSCKKAVVDLIQTKVAFLFTSVDCNVSKVLEGAKAELGTAPIIGCTSSAGIITPDGFISSENGFTGILALGDPELTVGVASSPKKEEARLTGQMVAKEAMKKAGRTDSPAYFYMVASPAEEEDYIKGIEDVIGRVQYLEEVLLIIQQRENGVYIQMTKYLQMELLQHFSTQIKKCQMYIQGAIIMKQ